MGAALEKLASMQGAGTARPVVVKLGGSVVRGGGLQAWLDVIANAKRKIVIVPGGGALADEVRHCQRQLGFGDVTAHRMALLAMDQLAWAVAGLRADLEVGATEAELRKVLDRGRVAIWAPSSLLAGRDDLEPSWRLTSDSLALWLAGRLGADACYLIKSVALPRARRSAGALARDNVVDEAFPAMLRQADVACAIFGQEDQAALGACLAGGTAPARHTIDRMPAQ